MDICTVFFLGLLLGHDLPSEPGKVPVTSRHLFGLINEQRNLHMEVL